MSSERKVKKQNLIKKVYELVSKHDQVVIVSLMNVGSNQVQMIRRSLGKLGATLLIGKNTVMKKAMTLRTQKLEDIKNVEEKEFFSQFGKNGIPQLQSLIDKTKGKIGLIFSDCAAFELKPVIESNRVKCDAKVGMIAQCDVTVPAGATGLDPSQISFFHALQVTTKINKGQIEIVKDFQVCKKGEPVTNNASALLKKLNITPFEYGMELVGVYDNGSILDPEIVSITPSSILEKFRVGVNNIAALSLELNIPTQASVPHLFSKTFKFVRAICAETGYGSELLTKFGSAQVATGASVAAPVQQTAAPVKKEEEKKVEEEEEDLGAGGLFDF